MNLKVVLGFLTGVVAASGIGYLITHIDRSPAPVTAIEIPAEPESARPFVPPPSKPLPRLAKIAPPTVASPETAAPSFAPSALPSLAPPPARPTAETPRSPAPPAIPAPPPPPAPNIVTIPRGTSLAVRLGEGLASDRNREGDEFTGTLDQPLVVDGFVLAERGAKARGRVLESVEAGRVRGLAQLKLELTRLRTADGQNVRIQTEPFVRQAQESKRDDAAKVGIGAALGAIIGAAAGGGKGAAIGAATGGAAGGGVVVATRGRPAVIPVETILTFRIEEPVTLTEQLH